jgi:hypothetical protein
VHGAPTEDEQTNPEVESKGRFSFDKREFRGVKRDIREIYGGVTRGKAGAETVDRQGQDHMVPQRLELATLRLDISRHPHIIKRRPKAPFSNPSCVLDPCLNLEISQHRIFTIADILNLIRKNPIVATSRRRFGELTTLDPVIANEFPTDNVPTPVRTSIRPHTQSQAELSLQQPASQSRAEETRTHIQSE